MKKVRRVVLAIACVYVLLLAVVYTQQRRLLYLAPAGDAPTLPGASIVRLTTDDGLPVLALHWPAASGRATVVHFHGNGDQLESTTLLARMLHERGLGFFAVEYPGYGAARPGTPSERGIYAVAERALRHLHEVLGVAPDRIVLQGHSLGSGVAAEMATRGHGARLVLVSPYTSMAAAAARVFPWLPVRLLLRDRYDTLAKAPSLRLPVLILHGVRDEVIPVAMGRALAQAIANAQLVEAPASGHNDMFAARGYAECIDRFAAGDTCPGLAR